MYQGTACKYGDEYVIGAVYWCGYWRYFYTVLATDGQSVQVRNQDGASIKTGDQPVRWHMTGLSRGDVLVFHPERDDYRSHGMSDSSPVLDARGESDSHNPTCAVGDGTSEHCTCTY